MIYFNFEVFLQIINFSIFFARKDIIGRFAGNVLGFFWMFLQPVFLILIYYFIFSIILKIKLPEIEGTKSFINFLIVGLFPWMAFQEGCMRGGASIIENAETVKKLSFPLESIPIGAVLTSYYINFIGLFIFIFIYFLFKYSTLTLCILILPIIIFLQLLATIGFSLILAAITTYIRDTLQFFSIIFQIWFYLTPIIYPKSLIPPKYKLFFILNPINGFVESYREIIYKGEFIFSFEKLWSFIFSILIFFLGYKIFSKLKTGFSEVL